MDKHLHYYFAGKVNKNKYSPDQKLSQDQLKKMQEFTFCTVGSEDGSRFTFKMQKEEMGAREKTF